MLMFTHESEAEVGFVLADEDVDVDNENENMMMIKNTLS